ncbi:MAG: glucokinase [Gemmatimonadaceae bacterium]
MRVLAGDIGGTHARLALVEVADEGARIVHARVVDSHSVSGIGMLVDDFRDAVPLDGVTRACFAIAGALMDGVWQTPNLPWEIRSATAAAEIGIPSTTVVNDFEAVGHALPLLTGSDLSTLQPGVPERHGSMALIGAGTGLGMAFVHWDGVRYRVHASEGGHADFAPRTPIECDLLAFLRERHGRVSTERILSGRGLAALYDFMVQRGEHDELPETRAAMQRDDPAAVVTGHALAGDDPLCVAALDLFLTVLGAAAGNLALTVLASGGVFLGGGIAPRLDSILRDGPFLRAFTTKGRLSPILTRTPVHLILRPEAGLIGAAAIAASG